MVLDSEDRWISVSGHNVSKNMRGAQKMISLTLKTRIMPTAPIVAIGEKCADPFGLDSRDWPRNSRSPFGK